MEPLLILLPSQNLREESQNRSQSAQSSAEAQHISAGGCRSTEARQVPGSIDPGAGGSGQQGPCAGNGGARDACADAAEPAQPRAGSGFASRQAGAGQKRTLFSPSTLGGGAAITLFVISWDDSRIKASKSPVE